jgi:hypothetical protein
MPVFEEWRFPEEISYELGKLRAKVAEARNKLESEKNLVEKRPLTYLQTRAQKTIDHHDKILLSLDDRFSEKKEKLEERYKSTKEILEEYQRKVNVLKKAIEGIEEEKEQERKHHETAIEKAKGEMDLKPISLIRAEDTLEKAIIARDKFLESAVQNTSAHLVMPTPPIELPPYTRPPRPVIPPVDDGKIYYDPDGNICTKGVYEIRQRAIAREEAHTRGEKCGDHVCVSCHPPKPKKLLKIAEKR